MAGRMRDKGIRQGGSTRGTRGTVLLSCLSCALYLEWNGRTVFFIPFFSDVGFVYSSTADGLSQETFTAVLSNAIIFCSESAIQNYKLKGPVGQLPIIKYHKEIKLAMVVCADCKGDHKNSFHMSISDVRLLLAENQQGHHGHLGPGRNAPDSGNR